MYPIISPNAPKFRIPNNTWAITMPELCCILVFATSENDSSFKAQYVKDLNNPPKKIPIGITQR